VIKVIEITLAAESPMRIKGWLKIMFHEALSGSLDNCRRAPNRPQKGVGAFHFPTPREFLKSEKDVRADGTGMIEGVLGVGNEGGTDHQQKL